VSIPYPSREDAASPIELMEACLVGTSANECRLLCGMSPIPPNPSELCQYAFFTFSSFLFSTEYDERNAPEFPPYSLSLLPRALFVSSAPSFDIDSSNSSIA
jgi:hypothetical protein